MAYRPTEKTEAHRSAQRQLLLQAALAVVSRHGFQGLTITAVAQQANLATGTVYKYFESKAVLCADVFRLATEREVDKVQQAAFPKLTAGETAVPCRQRLINAIVIFAQRAIQARRLAYALIAEPVDPMVESERLVYRQAYADIYGRLIQEGIEKKEFPQQNARLAAAALVGVVAETLISPLGRNQASGQVQEYPAEALISDLKQFCLRAITGMPT